MLALLWWNPVRVRTEPSGQALVLLDYSLSMSPLALDTARALARTADNILVYGDRVEPFDSTRVRMGSSRLAPALAQAAGRGGGAVIVTDGEIDDLADVAPDLLSQSTVVLVPRDTVPSLGIIDVQAPRTVSARDTVRLSVVVGAWGDGLSPGATLSVQAGEERVATTRLEVPAPGSTSRIQLRFPATQLEEGEQPLIIVVAADSADRESRDDIRLRLIEVSPLPAVVVVGAPADWETRFLAQTMREVVQVPTRTYLMIASNRWIDASTLAPISFPEVRAAAQQAALVVWRGPAMVPGLTSGEGMVWHWPQAAVGDAVAVPGDWYVTPPSASPLANALSGARWDSLPPLAAMISVTPAATEWIALSARLLRRGVERPAVVGRDSSGHRELTVAASGLWHWALRGGSAAEAYRSLIAAAADWLLGDRTARRDAVEPLVDVATRGLPVVFQRRDSTAGSVAIQLTRADTSFTDSLRFDGTHRANLLLPPGVYRYSVEAPGSAGLVAIEEYSAEFHPRPVVLASQSGAERAILRQTAARERWWLFALVVALLAGEWMWRRRAGLP